MANEVQKQEWVTVQQASARFRTQGWDAEVKRLERADKLVRALSEAVTDQADQKETDASVTDVYRQRISGIYQKHAPKMWAKNGAQKVEMVLTKFQGREHGMYLKFCKQYGC